MNTPHLGRPAHDSMTRAVRSYQREYGYTQGQIAALLGCSAESISRKMNGNIRWSLDDLMLLCFNMDPHFFTVFWQTMVDSHPETAHVGAARHSTADAIRIFRNKGSRRP